MKLFYNDTFNKVEKSVRRNISRVTRKFSVSELALELVKADRRAAETLLAELQMTDEEFSEGPVPCYSEFMDMFDRLVKFGAYIVLDKDVEPVEGNMYHDNAMQEALEKWLNIV